MQDVIRTALGNIIEQNGPAEAALLGLMVAAAVFAVGWTRGHPTATWWTTATQTIGLLAAVVVLALQVSHHGWLIDVDHSATTWFVAHRNPTLDHIALAVTTILGPISTAVITALVAVVVYLRTRSWACGLIVVATVGGASALCTAIKALVGRARPPRSIQEIVEIDHSFPSGHVTGAAALFGIIAVIIGLSRSRRVHGALAVVVALIVSAVALSRIYLGVHWFTDTLAGALLAAAVLTVAAAALHALLPDGFPAGTPTHQYTSRSENISMPLRQRVSVAVLTTSLPLLTACGPSAAPQPSGSSATAAVASEVNPPGDIPDTQVYVPFTPPYQLFTVSVPEGWAQTSDATAITFTDKLNAIRIEAQPAPSAPTPESAWTQDFPPEQSSLPGYQPGSVSEVQRKAGPVILVTYQVAAAPNAVTGKTGVDAVERYEFWRGGQEAILTLSGPVGADNIDPWRTITDSFQWL
jgi:membrane-associated phospholipid phosphatase